MLLVDTVGDFIVETFTRTEESDFRIGIEEVENTAGCYLISFTVNVNSLSNATTVLR